MKICLSNQIMLIQLLILGEMCIALATDDDNNNKQNETTTITNKNKNNLTYSVLRQTNRVCEKEKNKCNSDCFMC